MEHQEFINKMNEVAQKLGMVFEPFDTEFKNNLGEIKGEPANFWVSNGGWKQENRIFISPAWPIDNSGHTCMPYDREKLAITVDQNSTIDKIVSAIKKRFMLAYLPKYQEAIKIKNNNDEYDTKKTGNLDILTEYFGMQANKNEKIYPHYKENSFMPYSIEVTNENAKFELDLSIENAIKVFDLLKTL
jgi:hypothetical protein